MLELTSRKLSLSVMEDGSCVAIGDRARRCTWRVDRSRAGYRRGGDNQPLQPFGAGEARRTAEGIEIRYTVAGGTVRYMYALADDCVQVTLRCDAEDVERVSLPGPLLPDHGRREIAIPLYQGVLLGGDGVAWELTVGHGGHVQFSMAMGAVIGEKGALLVCHESPANWSATFGRAEDGPLFQFEHKRCPVDGWVGAAVRLYPTDPDVTAACKRYRARLKERGEFVTWQEKIARKPIVRDLFGALMAFVGYNACPDVDYAAGARELRAYGFESVFYYPVRMCHHSMDFRMGGDAPIWLSDHDIETLKSTEGAHVGPWGWVIEGLDDGSDGMHSIYRRGPDGEFIPNWRIDDQQWYLVCTPYQRDHIERRLASDMQAMDWIHFDVNAMWPGRCCFSTAHAPHDNRPLGHLGDLEWTRRLFSPETVGNRVVSSEGFADHYAGYYDVGSTKMMPPRPWNPGCVPIPMTMLVFHDSCIHDWWELHNYNAHPGFGLTDVRHGLGTTGSGQPELKAAIDALYGCPPNLFPFGKQYSWVDIQTRESYAYLVRLEDAAVQAALRAALPVTRLHKQIATCELVSFAFLSDDRAAQSSTFSDGTRVIANLADRETEVAGCGALPPHSWRRL